MLKVNGPPQAMQAWKAWEMFAVEGGSCLMLIFEDIEHIVESSWGASVNLCLDRCRSSRNRGWDMNIVLWIGCSFIWFKARAKITLLSFFVGIWHAGDGDKIVDVVVPAGSVVLFNSRLLHGARQNQHGSRTRYSLCLGDGMCLVVWSRNVRFAFNLGEDSLI